MPYSTLTSFVLYLRSPTVVQVCPWACDDPANAPHIQGCLGWNWRSKRIGRFDDAMMRCWTNRETYISKFDPGPRVLKWAETSWAYVICIATCGCARLVNVTIQHLILQMTIRKCSKKKSETPKKRRTLQTFRDEHPLIYTSYGIIWKPACLWILICNVNPGFTNPGPRWLYIYIYII